MKRRSAIPSWPERLLAWYRAHCRELPWRSEPSPYRVWISEIMLQQTQVATVRPYFDRFIARFPDLPALATANPQDLLKAWEGLGYYSRVRNLQKAAKTVVNELKGELPADFTRLQELPGIGPYTAAAIASIAFNQPVPVVDGNVLRVFCRYWGIDEDIRGPGPRREIFARLQQAIGDHPPADFNQALMELGALVCRPRQPACAGCPLAADCIARRDDRTAELPRKGKAAAVPHYDIAVGVIFDGRGRILIARRDEAQMLGGLWEFPGGKLETGESAEQAVVREVREETGLEIAVLAPIATIRHAYSHFKITLQAFRCRKLGGRLKPDLPRPMKWVKPEELADYPFPRANQKLLPMIMEALGTSLNNS